MTANRWFMQRLADILQKPVESASMAETTALGAAYIAGQAIGFYGDDTELAAHRASVTTFLPEMSASESAERHAGWLQAVSKVRSEVQGETDLNAIIPLRARRLTGSGDVQSLVKARLLILLRDVLVRDASFAGRRHGVCRCGWSAALC